MKDEAVHCDVGEDKFAIKYFVRLHTRLLNGSSTGGAQAASSELLDGVLSVITRKVKSGPRQGKFLAKKGIASPWVEMMTRD